MENLIQIFKQGEHVAIFKSLAEFNKDNEQKCEFIAKDTTKYQDFVSLLSKLFIKLQDDNEDSSKVHECVRALLIMSRNQLVINKDFVSEVLWKRLATSVGIIENKYDYPQKLKVDSLKCLSNLIFLSEQVQSYCKNEDFLKGLLSLIAIDKLSVTYQQYLLHRLLFIVTAVNPAAKDTLVEKFNARKTLTDCVKELLKTSKSLDNPTATHRRLLSVDAGKIVDEILKTLFSLNMNLRKETAFEQSLIDELHDLTNCCRKCLLTRCESSNELTLAIHSDAGNVIYSVPGLCFSDNLLIPKVQSDAVNNDAYAYSGDEIEIMNEKDMSAIIVLLNLLAIKVDEPKPSAHSLQPILSLLSCLSQTCPDIRKFCKKMSDSRNPTVATDNRDVYEPPISGYLSIYGPHFQLVTHAPTRSCHNLSHFAVWPAIMERFVKYTGFGNAAGLLASRGLLAGGKGNTSYSDTDSDSDTEEYVENADKIDPVTGHIPPPRPNPMEGMTEEQKEYLAVQLACEINKMSAHEVIQPVCIGEDGKLIPIQQKVHETKLKEESEDSD